MSKNLSIDQWREEYTKLYKEYRPKLEAIEKEISEKAEKLGMDGFEVSGLIIQEESHPLG